ncbi:DUF305 domain-containing protein [Bradyrhizobium sp. STM 3562]|uniref:CopM family metallochaperone n=1 Tax=Bradyrhizobium sp. STM 3562 TaxID=578924 RepID=UPI00388D4D9B
MAWLSRSFLRKRLISLATTMSVSATSFALAQDQTGKHHLPAPADNSEQRFMIDNDLAMSKMSRDMMVDPSGDIDRDFVAMMIPHHQGAIDMARAELKYGQNKQLRELAQSIVTQQGQEIAQMRRAIGGASPAGPEAAQQRSSMNSRNMH